MATYLDPAHYEALIQALLTGTKDPLDHENAIKLALGEHADVWPDSIKEL